MASNEFAIGWAANSLFVLHFIKGRFLTFWLFIFPIVDCQVDDVLIMVGRVNDMLLIVRVLLALHVFIVHEIVSVFAPVNDSEPLGNA